MPIAMAPGGIRRLSDGEKKASNENSPRSPSFLWLFEKWYGMGKQSAIERVTVRAYSLVPVWTTSFKGIRCLSMISFRNH
jgi:hypothetical protein